MENLFDMNGNLLEDKLALPITLNIDETETVTCRSFSEYANWMMYPDPADVELPQTTAALIAWLVNNGTVRIFDALRVGSTDYQYDEQGWEYISFPEPAEMSFRLKARYPDITKELPSVVRVHQPNGMHGWGLEFNCGIHGIKEDASSFVRAMRAHHENGWFHQSGHNSLSAEGAYVGYQFFEYCGSNEEQTVITAGKVISREIGAFFIAPEETQNVQKLKKAKVTISAYAVAELYQMLAAYKNTREEEDLQCIIDCVSEYLTLQPGALEVGPFTVLEGGEPVLAQNSKDYRCAVKKPCRQINPYECPDCALYQHGCSGGEDGEIALEGGKIYRFTKGVKE